MATHKPDSIPAGMSMQDVLFTIFKHKWKIVLFACAGLGAAAYVYLTHASTYESDAKLLVRYVLDRNVVDPVDSAGGGRANDNAIGAEVEILTSYDLAVQVAEAIGVDRLAPDAPRNGKVAFAAQAVQGGLVVNPRGNVLLLSYKSESPALAVNVLQELVTRYFVKHLEVHRSAGAFDFVTQQADQIRGRLSQTEDELKRVKDKAGVISLADSTTVSSAEVNRLQLALGEATTERAEQIARLQSIEKGAANATPGSQATPGRTPNVTVPSSSQPSHAEAEEYQALVTHLTQSRQYELDLLAKYRPENQQVQIARSQIADLERRRAALAAKFPDLAAKTISGGTQQGPDIVAERAHLAAVEARIETLKAQFKDAQQRAEMLANVAPQIVQLERQKELEETNYRYFAGSLEKARVDEALDPSKIPNISVVQKPSTAFRTVGTLRHTLVGLAAGGLALGLGLAFLIEMVFAQSIKRPSEFERRLHIPLLLSIPLLKKTSAPRALRASAEGGDGGKEALALASAQRAVAVPWSTGHFIRPFAEAIRDRLGLYFELNNLTHKPKLVAVTSFNEGGGASTIAAGVAAALSEMGEGKVLLVDMNVGRPELHPFFDGKPAHALMTALQPACPIAPAADNLYLATPLDESNNKQVQLGPKRLYELMPSLKASSFDYIIFDMPSLDQSSVAMSMAGLMDKVLLITEAEKCGAALIQRTYKELNAARANVSCVLNKTRRYGPKLMTVES